MPKDNGQEHKAKQTAYLKARMQNRMGEGLGSPTVLSEHKNLPLDPSPKGSINS